MHNLLVSYVTESLITLISILSGLFHTISGNCKDIDKVQMRCVFMGLTPIHGQLRIML